MSKISNIIIKKTKKISSLSQKHVAKNMKFLSENLNAKAKLKNMKARCAMKNVEKKSAFTLIFNQKKFV